MKLSKWIVGALLLVSLAFPVSAKVTLTTVTHWNLGTGAGALLAQYVEEYNAMQSDVEIELYSDAGAGQVDRILLWAASNTMPDILPVSQVHMADLMQAGIMIPLPQFAADTLAEAYVPAATEMVRYDGKLWGYPSEYIPTLFTYDTVAFEETGLPLYFPDNWSDLLDTAKKLTVRSETGEITRAGIGWDNNVRSNVAMFLSHTWTSDKRGKEIFNSNATVIDLVTPAAQDTMEFIDQLFNVDRVATLGGSRALADQAIRWSQSHHRGSIAAIPGRLEEIRSAHVPKGADGQRIASVYGWAYIVPSLARHPQEAHEFMRWFATEPMADGTTRLGNIMAALGSVPSTKTDVQNQANFREELFFGGFIEAIANNEMRPWPTPLANQDVLAAMNTAVRAVIAQDKTVLQALVDAQTSAQTLIDGASK